MQCFITTILYPVQAKNVSSSVQIINLPRYKQKMDPGQTQAAKYCVPRQII
jgi:hypothetical protein